MHVRICIYDYAVNTAFIVITVHIYVIITLHCRYSINMLCVVNEDNENAGNNSLGPVYIFLLL